MNLKKCPLYFLLLSICLSSTMFATLESGLEEAKLLNMMSGGVGEQGEGRVSTCSKVTKRLRQGLSSCLNKLIRFTDNNKCFIDLSLVAPAYCQAMILQDFSTALSSNACDSNPVYLSNTLAMADLQKFASSANAVVMGMSFFACSSDAAAKFISTCFRERFSTEVRFIKGISCFASAASLMAACSANGVLVAAFNYTSEVPYSITRPLDLAMGFGAAVLVFETLANMPAIVFICPSQPGDR